MVSMKECFHLFLKEGEWRFNYRPELQATCKLEQNSATVARVKIKSESMSGPKSNIVLIQDIADHAERNDTTNRDRNRRQQ